MGFIIFFWGGGGGLSGGHLDELMPAPYHTTMYKGCKVCEIRVSHSSLLGYDAISVGKLLPSIQRCILEDLRILENIIICSYKASLICDLANRNI